MKNLTHPALASLWLLSLAAPLACGGAPSNADQPADMTPPDTSPSFSIELSTTKLPVQQGGHASLDVSIQRKNGFEGDVVVSAEGLPAGVVPGPLTIPAGESEGVLELDAPEGTAHSLPTNVTVTGKSAALEDSRELTVTVYGSPGAVDTSFQGGNVMVPIGGTDAYANAMTAQADGKLIVVGNSHDHRGDFAVLRLTRDGAIDSGFGAAGVVTTEVGTGSDVARAVALDAKGRIVVAGTTDSGAGLDFAVVRYLSDGRLDDSFGDQGKTIVGFGEDSDTAYAIAIQADGKIVVAGDANLGSSQTGVDFALLRLTPDGTLDESFGDGGRVTASVATFGGRDSVYALALQSIDGEERILVAGGEGDFSVARFLPDGALDASFGKNGKLGNLFGSNIGAARALALTADNEIVVAGHAQHDFALVKLSQAGALVDGFGSAGKVTTPVSANNWDEAVGLGIAEDGKILAAGWSYEGNSTSGNTAVVRYDERGKLDPSFGQGGIVVSEVAAPSKSDLGSALLIQPDERVPSERILVAGIASSSFYQFAVTRFWR